MMLIAKNIFNCYDNFLHTILFTFVCSKKSFWALRAQKYLSGRVMFARGLPDMPHTKRPLDKSCLQPEYIQKAFWQPTNFRFASNNRDPASKHAPAHVFASYHHHKMRDKYVKSKHINTA